ncbi:glycine-rich protein, partial [Emticicia fontis]
MKKLFTIKNLCLLILFSCLASFIAKAQKPDNANDISKPEAVSYASDGTIISKDAKKKNNSARRNTTNQENNKSGSQEIKKKLVRPLSTAATNATITCPSSITTDATTNCGAVVNYTSPTISDNVPFQSQTFNFTGDVVDWVVPSGVTTINVKLWGAQGGANWVNNTNFGGYSEGTLSVTPGETLKIYVGGQATSILGGWNGGGDGDGAGKGGGGASDIRQGGNTLNDRKIVAAGGGGAGYWSFLHVVGGVGGGLTGGDGYRGSDFNTNPGGKGATQTAGGADGTCVSFNVPVLGGSFGQGGTPAGNNCGCEGYGGGGGWYGGAGSGNCRGGGGGSGYIGGVTNGNMEAGIQTGNGKIEITYGGTVTQTAGLASGALFPIGITTNTFEFDDNGTPKTCSFTVAVNAVPTSVSYSSASYCKPTVATNISVTITGLPNGTFSSSPAGLAIDPNTGMIDLLNSSTGTYTIAYSFSGCNSPAATTSLTINIPPSTPTDVSVNNTSVCSGGSVSLTAACSAGTVTWYNQATGGISIGTGTNLNQNPTANINYYASCAESPCESSRIATNPVTVTTQPSAPTITAPATKVVCSPSTLTLTASGCAGTVNWSTGTSGTSLVLSSAGTYSITATCTVGSCTSPSSTAVTGLQIVTQPSAPTITAPATKVVCSPS